MQIRHLLKPSRDRLPKVLSLLRKTILGCPGSPLSGKQSVALSSETHPTFEPPFPYTHHDSLAGLAPTASIPRALSVLKLLKNS